ncbi:hypothetical protein B0H63DRAFT_394533 [Podospora didyma]|uniref:Uncharacterized protein n=1 Tax=Podospora didyma TaxID=330526 RepID=A0AAE0NQK4_9PEZI|nr:hypothetical protein B0H63DRAFT_394533 [Podospora didyma]
MLVTMPNQRQLVAFIAFALTAAVLLRLLFTSSGLGSVWHKEPEKPPPHPTYKPKPTFTPPPVKDNFPLLATSTPPPVPKWNAPAKDLYKEYNLRIAPPLLIGFTRTWPILLQCVVSYITAGWPPEQIYVVENTGVQQANARGQLTLQNQFYLNHTTLKTLGVNIVQTPTLLSFAQLQNFYLSLTYANNWPYYFWSHQDVLALSYEDGHKLTPKATEPGFKSLYKLALEALKATVKGDPHWGIRFFAYDHLALVNPKAYEDVGGWDTLIPYYITDCDMHSRLRMRNWTMEDAKAGIITDVATALDDLRALYRVDGVEPVFTDPNPPPPKEPEPKRGWFGKRGVMDPETEEALAGLLSRRGDVRSNGPPEDQLNQWRKLLQVSDSMYHYKHGERGRNTWQLGQQGGKGEPFYYPTAGLAEGIDVMTETGREVFRRKWGHRDCDLITGRGLGFEDQWLVMKDWED